MLSKCPAYGNGVRVDCAAGCLNCRVPSYRFVSWDQTCRICLGLEKVAQRVVQYSPFKCKASRREVDLESKMSQVDTVPGTLIGII